MAMKAKNNIYRFAYGRNHIFDMIISIFYTIDFISILVMHVYLLRIRASWSFIEFMFH